MCTHTHTRAHMHTPLVGGSVGARALPASALQIFLFFLTRKAFSPPFTRENKLLKCEMKPCLIKRGIRRAGAILLVEQRSGRGDES